MFPVAALTVWIPIFLELLAKQHACPYTYEPLNKATYNYTVDPGGVWEGFYNKTTTCRYDYSEFPDEEPPLWMERLNPLYGINVLPVYIRQKEHGKDDEEEAKINGLDEVRAPEHLLYEKKWNVVCDAPGNVDVVISPIRNVSTWATDRNRGDEVGNEQDMPWWQSTSFHGYDGAPSHVGPVEFDFVISSGVIVEVADLR